MTVLSGTGSLCIALAVVGISWTGGDPDDAWKYQTSPDQTEGRDLLTFAQGALFVSQSGLATGSAGRALRMIDGDTRKLALTTDAGDPVEFLYKLPANTTFDRFAIPNVVETPGNATFFRSVEISGSLEGPESGFQVLASGELETHGPDQNETELAVLVATPVRWVRVNLEGGINIEEGDEGRTNLEFTEIIGTGSQEQQEISTAFDGLWDFRLTERLDLRGTPLQLHQTGATITGCLGTVMINGSVNGRIARANGIDTRNDRPNAFIFVADDDESIYAVRSVNGGTFRAQSAVVDPGVAAPDCPEPPPEPKACGLSVYVNFDFDSAVIRPESDQVLADLQAALVAEGAERVVIEGHTSTEGTEEYNLDLSERRAQAVVEDLIARGFDEAKISASGQGETQPLMSPDNDETSRELNRRVEIECGQGG
jgi:outer membrane protein OmpA-like peptidoglycan-associated protein